MNVRKCLDIVIIQDLSCVAKPNREFIPFPLMFKFRARSGNGLIGWAGEILLVWNLSTLNWKITALGEY